MSCVYYDHFFYRVDSISVTTRDTSMIRLQTSEESVENKIASLEDRSQQLWCRNAYTYLYDVKYIPVFPFYRFKNKPTCPKCIF